MRTQKLKKIEIILKLLSWLLCFGLFITFVSIGYSRYVTHNATTMIEFEAKFGSLAAEQVEKLKAIAISGFVAIFPMLILSLLVKDKIKPTIWMLNVILANILVASWAMYMVFGIWIIENYILTPLAKKYKLKYQINKEIDNRG